MKGHRFLPFAKNMGKNIGKNLSKNLSSKYRQKHLDLATKLVKDSLKTGSKRTIQKTTKATEIRGIIVFYENILQMINFKIKCPKITTYAKTPMK